MSRKEKFLLTFTGVVIWVMAAVISYFLAKYTNLLGVTELQEEFYKMFFIVFSSITMIMATIFGFYRDGDRKKINFTPIIMLLALGAIIIITAISWVISFWKHNYIFINYSLITLFLVTVEVYAFGFTKTETKKR